MVLVIAHRGLTETGVQENSVEAFDLAFSNYCDGIELDVHLTKDQHWVIFHDKTIFGSKLSQLTKSQIQKIANKHQLQVPYLDDILEQFPDKIINIECKPNSREIGEKLAKFIINHGNLNFHHISSFKYKSLQGARNFSSKIRLSYITLFPLSFRWKTIHKKLNLFSVNPLYQLTSAKTVQKLHNHGIKVHPWTVNTNNQMHQMIKSEVDAIITDKPKLLMNIKQQIEGKH